MIWLLWSGKATTMLAHSYLLVGIALENLFQSLGIVIGACLFMLLQDLSFQQVFLFLFIFCYFPFLLCASLMSRLVLDVILLQKLGVFGIILLQHIPIIQKKGYT